MIKANPSPKGNGFAFNLFGDPNGIRTHDTTVKGWCLNRLTMGPLIQALYGCLSPPAVPLKKRGKQVFIFSTCAVVFLVAAVRFEPTTCRV